MYRKHFATAAVLVGLFFVLVGSAAARTVEVVDKPGDGQWTISFSRKHGPDVFELDTFRKTKAEALQEAERLKAWSNSMDANSSWRLAVILIEGEDARPPKPKGEEDQGLMPKLKSFKEVVDNIREAKDIVDDPLGTLKSKMDPKKGLKDYIKQVEGAYERAKEAKQELIANTKSLTDKEFAEVNILINQYNSQLSTYQSGPDAAYFARFPKMTPVGPQTVQKVQQWREAKGKEAQLADDKQRLDGERSRIEQERQSLAEEGRSLQAEEVRVRKLREQATAGEGPYNARPNGDIVIPGQWHFLESRPKKFATYQEAIDWLTHLGDGYGDPDRHTIRDRNGNVVTEPPKKVDTTELDNAEKELRERRVEYNRRLQKYRQELLGGYNGKLRSYKGNIQSHAAVVQSWEQALTPQRLNSHRLKGCLESPNCDLCWFVQ